MSPEEEVLLSFIDGIDVQMLEKLAEKVKDASRDGMSASQQYHELVHKLGGMRFLGDAQATRFAVRPETI